MPINQKFEKMVTGSTNVTTIKNYKNYITLDEL